MEFGGGLKVIQNTHLHFRYVQRVLGVEGNEIINQYIKDNYYKIYHDIDVIFNESIKIAERWQTFDRKECFDYYVYQNKYLFSLNSDTQEALTLIRISNNLNDKELQEKVKQLIVRLRSCDERIAVLKRRKEKHDQQTRQFECALRYCPEKSDELRKLINESVENAKSAIAESKGIKLLKQEIIYSLAVDFDMDRQGKTEELFPA